MALIGFFYTAYIQIPKLSKDTNKQIMQANKQFEEQFNQTEKQITENKKMYEELNRPFVALSDMRKLEIMGGVLMLPIKNFGKTAAKELKLSIYYINKNDNQQKTMFQDIMEKPIGIFYPEQEAILPVQNPCLIETMKDEKFNIQITYKYLDKCVQYDIPIFVQPGCSGFVRQSLSENICPE